MSAVEAGGGEIIIQIVCLEGGQSIELVLQPLPHIAIHVVEPHGIWRKHVHRLGEGMYTVAMCLAQEHIYTCTCIYVQISRCTIFTDRQHFMETIFTNPWIVLRCEISHTRVTRTLTCTYTNHTCIMPVLYMHNPLKCYMYL